MRKLKAETHSNFETKQEGQSEGELSFFSSLFSFFRKGRGTTKDATAIAADLAAAVHVRKW